MRKQHTTIRDICEIAGTRHLSQLLDGPEKLSGLILADIEHRELAKDTALYLLGLVPMLGNIANALSGADLLTKLWDARQRQSKIRADSLLYFSGMSVLGKHADDTSPTR
jgi:hypothetical protein